MPDRDVVLAKVATIRKCLDRIRDVTDLDPGKLEDIDRQDIFVLNLQRAVQACIDLASHAVAAEALGLPEKVRDNFSILREKGVVDPELASKMEKMTGFRNIAVRNYQALDLDILKSILSNNLKDLEDFSSALLHYWGYV
ncbi:MAG: hypothetical protein PWR02_101 [Synergistales bacterium]|nr:hypothetical protein [Synergistales bacterium]